MGHARQLKAQRRRVREAIKAGLTRSRAEMKAEAQNLSRVTPEGRVLGAQLVRLTEATSDRLVQEGEPDTRCVSCAFRLGTVPNGCPQTGMDATKAVLEGTPFLGQLRLAERGTCHGWYAGRVALQGRRQTMPYRYSAEQEEGHGHHEA